MWLHTSIFIGFVLFIRGENLPCKHKDFGRGGTVCVCNDNYCDTVEPVEKVDAPEYLQYVSNKQGLRFEKSIGSFKKMNGKADVTVTVDADVKYQTIHGWGGAFLDSAGININSLPTKARDNLLKSYFSSEGIEYSLCRVPIGGTDFSTHGYSYNDGPTDVNLTNFDLAPEDHLLKIPIILEANKLTGENLQLFASVWTAPKWMKTNNDYVGIGFLKEEMYQVWANYFVKFFDAYKNNGIQFWGVTTQNEPSLAIIPIKKVNSIAWTTRMMGKWLSENLGPTLRNSVYSNLKIMCLDDQRFFLPWFVDKLFENDVARNYVDGIAVHWYWNSIIPASILNITHNKHPDKFILSTEACKGDKPWEEKVILGSWSRGEEYARDIIENAQNWVTGWVDWGIALDTRGGPTYIDNYVDSPVIVNETAGEFYKQPMFYAIGHFSKFVPPGSVRISHSQTQNVLKVVVFLRPDGGTVIEVLNKQSYDITLKINDKRRGGINIIATKNSFNTILYW